MVILVILYYNATKWYYQITTLPDDVNILLHTYITPYVYYSMHIAYGYISIFLYYFEKHDIKGTLGDFVKFLCHSYKTMSLCLSKSDSYEMNGLN